jgi:DNA-binding FadR family transcriptional regulator
LAADTRRRQTAERPSRGYQEVAARVLRLVRTQRLKPGDRLPGEIDLARACGVSRPTIREAMIALEIAGEIEIRSGSGAYVRDASTRLSLLLDSGPGPFELLRARLLIEGETAAEAAISAQPHHLARIDASLVAMRRAVERGQNTQPADREFHVAIAEAANNFVLAGIVDGLWAGIFSPIFHTLSQRTGLHQHQSMTLADHEAIFTAIKKRNAHSARESMRSHLRHVEAILSAPAQVPPARAKPRPASHPARARQAATKSARRPKPSAVPRLSKPV